jgi:hypothetical protein
MDDSFHTLDVVELTAASGRWPAGTVGTVVEHHEQTLLVEIGDERGHALEYLEVPAHVTRRVEASYTQPHLTR